MVFSLNSDYRLSLLGQNRRFFSYSIIIFVVHIIHILDFKFLEGQSLFVAFPGIQKLLSNSLFIVCVHWIPNADILGTHQLQNSSKPVLVAFEQEKNVSAVGACLGRIALARTCVKSRCHPPRENVSSLIAWKLLLVLASFGTRHKFQNKLTMTTEVPCTYQREAKGFIRIISCNTLRGVLCPRSCSW